jgi:hypothetical protein
MSIHVPCRELAFQLADQFRALGAGITLKVWVCSQSDVTAMQCTS